MNIFNISSEIELTHPNYTLIDNSLASMVKLDAEARYAFTATSFLPGLQVKWEKMYKNATLCRNAVRGDSETIVIQLNKTFRQLTKLRNQYHDLTDVDDQDDNLHIREHELKVAEKKYNEYLSQLRGQISALQGLTINTAQMSNYVPGLETEISGLDNDVAEIDARIATLESARKTLTEGMAPLEKKNFADIGKDTLLTAEKINELGVSPPEVELIKLAIEHMKNVLEGISRNINYLEMHRERQSVVSRIKDENDARNAVLTKKTDAEHKIALINAVLKLNAEYSTVTSELAKIEQSTEKFVQLVSNNNAAQDDKETRFVTAVPYLIKYLEAVR